MPDKSSQLKAILELLNNSVTKQEFLDAFKGVLKTVKDIKDTNTAEFNAIHKAVKLLSQKVKDDAAFDTAELKGQVKDEVQKQIKVINAKLQAVDAKLATVINGENGEDGEDGVTPSIEELIALIKPLIPEPLKGDKGDPGEAGSTGRALVGWGAHPLNLYDSSGAVIDDVTRHIKFTGATLSRSPDGVVTVAISSNGFTELDPTETPDGSTTVFTFSGASAKPSYVVADNVWLKATSKAGTVNWTWSSGTKQATLTIPPNDECFAVV